MAQSPNAMQEPSMDELLASIREIIEENAGLSSGEHSKQNAENGSRPAHADMHAPHRQGANNAGGTASRQPDIRSAGHNAGAPVQDAMNALAERIGLRKGGLAEQDSAATRTAVPQAQAAQRMSVVREVKPDVSPLAGRQPQQPQPFKKRLPESLKDVAVKETEDAEKGLRSDVERSAELLLRPYIAQWLDEHFRHLFERILREEIQRFTQALRR